MTTTLIVLAHPDRRSFNGAWARATEMAEAELGHTVLTSDLCAMGFSAVESPEHYPDWSGAVPFDTLKVQEEAAARASLPSDVQAEIEKLKKADRVVFHFPLWWFSPPAVLKGWFDRALVHGAIHSVSARFDSGLCRGKKALFCVTTGSSASESAHNGKEGDVDMLLWPTAYTLRYLGFSVLKPKVVHGVHGYHTGDGQKALEARLTDVLEGQKALMRAFDSRREITFNSDADFDERGQLRPESPSHSLFIRHKR